MLIPSHTVQLSFCGYSETFIDKKWLPDCFITWTVVNLCCPFSASFFLALASLNHWGLQSDTYALDGVN